MAVQTSDIFEGFSGSINRQLLFRQCSGKTIVSKFPDRSAVIYSENQMRQQRRFADAVSFARIVISNEVLFRKYSIQASLLGFRSAWNVAIAEYMSTGPLNVKPQKIKFDKTIISGRMGKHIKVKLAKRIQPDTDSPFKQLKEKPCRMKPADDRKRTHTIRPPLPRLPAFTILKAFPI